MFLQYQSETNGQDIVTLVDKTVKTNSTSFPLAEKTLYANEGVRTIWTWIFQVYGGWIYDDSNQTDLPEITTNLVSGQTFYALPNASSSLLGLEYLNSGGVWLKLNPITLEQIKDSGFAESQFYNVSSTPLFYRPIANGFKLYPAPNFSVTSGLRGQISRDVTSFTPTDTTKVPGFDPLFHEAVATYIALKYAKINGLSVAGGVMRGGFKTGLLADWSDWEDRIKKHYSRRFAQLFPARMSVVDGVKDFS